MVGHRNGSISRSERSTALFFSETSGSGNNSKLGGFNMKSNENKSKSKTYFIYIRSTGEKVPVSKEQHDAFYKEADRIRHKEQDHGVSASDKM